MCLPQVQHSPFQDIKPLVVLFVIELTCFFFFFFLSRMRYSVKIMSEGVIQLKGTFLKRKLKTLLKKNSAIVYPSGSTPCKKALE